MKLKHGCSPSLETIIRSDGQNAIFDFTRILPDLQPYTVNAYLTLPPEEGTAYPGYASHFEDHATDVWRIQREGVPDAYLYRRITNDSLQWLGNGIYLDTNQDGIEDDVVNIFRDAKLQAPLPMALGQSWSTNFTHIGFVDTPIGPVEAPGIREMHDIAVDGYGTLVIPEGSFECLRVRINQTIIRPDGGEEKIGGWTYVTANLIQVGVFYDEHVPADPTDITFDVQTPSTISAFLSAEANTATYSEAFETLPPPRFVLSPNFPNPFRQATNLPFHLDKPAQVQLEVFDALGREQATLVNALLPAGSHVATWHPEGLPAGTYVYRLIVDGRTQHRPMILVR